MKYHILQKRKISDFGMELHVAKATEELTDFPKKGGRS